MILIFSLCLMFYVAGIQSTYYLIMKERQWKKEFRLLLKRSVVTGIPELLATRNNCRRFLRTCILLLCLTGFFYYTYLFLLSYWQYPTTMDVVIETPEEVDIPAISFCSYNGITASKFCSRFPEKCTPWLNYTKFCKENNDFFCDLNYIMDPNETIPAVTPLELPKISREEFKELGNKPEDLMHSCRIRHTSSYANCSNKTEWISVFDSMGLPNNCYAINSLVGNTTADSIGTMRAKSRIEMKIKTLTEDTFYTSTPTAIQMSVHSPRVILNPFKKGFAIKPCYNYYVYVSKTINSLLPYPYNTNCTDYLSLWKARGGQGPLSKTQCREECLLNVSLAERKCVDPFFVAYPNTANICSEPARTERIFRHCNKGCLRACYREDVAVDVEEHASLLAKNSESRTRKCLSLIVLAFNRMEVKTFAYYPKYQTIELFGYIGGFLGVWLGISLLAITDVLETFYLIVKALRRCFKKRRKPSDRRKSLENQLQMFDPYHDYNSVGRRIIKIY